MTEFLTASTKLPSYLVFPRFLLDLEISETSKILYMVLLDRAKLSQKNENWTDTFGHVFLYFTITDLALTMHKSEMTIKNCLTALEQLDLIVRKRMGVGNPNRIYVKIPEDFFQTDRKLSLRQTENYLPDGQKTVSMTDRKLSTNKNNRVNNHLVKIETSKSTYGSFQNVFLSDKDYQDLKSTVRNVDTFIDRLSSYMHSTGKTYSDHAATIKSWAVKDQQLIKQYNYECNEEESL